MTEVLRTGRVIDLADGVVLLSRDGRELPVADSAAPVRESDGSLGGIVLVFRDQTREREARREAQAEERQARKSQHQRPDDDGESS